ncbi:MAG: hypothetical protein AAF707_00260 [Pseudomonadota bacterium]
MTNASFEPIHQLQSQLYALQQLVLAQSIALAHIDAQAARTALGIACGQADALRTFGCHLASARLSGLVQEIEQCLE